MSSGNALYFDQQIVGDTMYVLRDDGVVESTTDLINWTHLVTGVPTDARSLAVLDNALYLGALNGVLYEYDTLIPEPTGLIVFGIAGLLMLRRRGRPSRR